MLYTLSFTDFHDPRRLERFIALSERLGADLPYGIDPLFSYRMSRPLPGELAPESLVYLSDIVFHSAVAWCTSRPPPTELSLIGVYADIAELERAPKVLVSPLRSELVHAILEPDRPVFALFPEQDGANLEAFADLERARHTRGLLELRAPRWAELAPLLGFGRRTVVSHAPLDLDAEIAGFLIEDQLELAALAVSRQSFGVLGFEHVDDSFLLSLNQPFWIHEETDTLRL